VTARLYRQAIFDWADPPDTVVVLDKAVTLTTNGSAGSSIGQTSLMQH
jgi:hypothetical protein